MFPYSHAVGGTFWRRFTIKLSYFKQKYGHKKQLALFTVFPALKSGNVSFHNLPFLQKRVHKSWQPASRKPRQELCRRAGACNKKTAARKVIYTEKRTGLPNTLAAITPTDILSCRRSGAHCARKTITRVSGKNYFAC